MKSLLTLLLFHLGCCLLLGQPSTTKMRFDSALQEVKSYRDVDTDFAMSLAQKLLISLDTSGTEIYKNAVQNELAVLLSYQEKHDEALALAYEVAHTAQKLGDTTTEINALHNIGIELYYLDELVDAQKRFSEALILSLAASDSAQIGYSYVNLGLIEGEFGNTEREIQYYKDALEIFDLMDDSDGIATSVLNLGEVFRLQQRYDLAGEYIRKALDMFKERGNKRGEAILLSSLAELYAETGDSQKSLQAIKQGLLLCEENGYVYDKIIFLNLFKEWKVGRKDFAKAYSLAEEVATLQDSIYSVEKSQEMIRLSKRFQLMEKEQEIYKLKSDNQLSRVQVLQIETERRIILILFMVVLVASSVLAYLMVKLSKAKKLIETQNNQLVIQMDQRQRLFGIIAHDMKGPLSAFATLSGLLATVEDRKQLEGYLTKLHRSALTLKEQVNNLLSWTMADQGQMEAIPEKINVSEGIENTLLLLKNMIELKEISIENEVQSNYLALFTETHFQIILRNFLSNAIKYTPSGGTINFSARKAKERFLELRIRDTGVGMTEEEMQIALSKEGIKREIRNSEEKGTGLGLMISQRLLTLNGGSMDLESEKNIGTIVNLYLPMAKSLGEDIRVFPDGYRHP